MVNDGFDDMRERLDVTAQIGLSNSNSKSSKKRYTSSFSFGNHREGTSRQKRGVPFFVIAVSQTQTTGWATKVGEL